MGGCGEGCKGSSRSSTCGPTQCAAVACSRSDCPFAKPRPILVVNKLSVALPGSDNLMVENLNLSLRSGESLLIVGPSGVGKSSLLRTICGLWKPQSGSISMPESAMFLPQNAYIPDIPLEMNSLEAQIVFPGDGVPSKDLVPILKRVNLGHLMGTLGIQTCDDWKKRLSNGEKQRLALARLLAKVPEIAFLDESTSALDSENERVFYETLRELGCSYISVGHREGVVKFHDRVLEIQGCGKWSLLSVSEYLK